LHKSRKKEPVPLMGKKEEYFLMGKRWGIYMRKRHKIKEKKPKESKKGGNKYWRGNSPSKKVIPGIWGTILT